MTHLAARMTFPMLWFGLSGIMGCAELTTNRSVVLPVQQALVGKTKQQLLVCAGTPVNETTKGDSALFLYYKEASLLDESFPGSKSSFARVHHGCRATVVVREDRVAEVRYESVPKSYRDDDLCEELFEPCAGL